ncbi:MAG TPA: metallophosphoesterase [bacterium]|nr:metallophosphoesterase [bacterium]HQP99578.1 metallophosphoesterase [bacterium]
MTDLDSSKKATPRTILLFRNAGDWIQALAGLAGIIWVTGNLFLLTQCLLIPHFPLGMVGRVYNFNTLVIPVILLCTGILILLIGRKKTLSVGTKRCALGMIALAVLLSAVHLYATHIEPHRLVLRTITLQTPKLGRPLTLLHISDIQSAHVGEYEESVFAQIRELNPDLIVHTGDLLQPVPASTWDSEYPKIKALFNTLSPSLGLFTVLGNTDVDQMDYFANGVGNMRVLQSEDIVIPWGDHRLHLYGMTLDQSWSTNPQPIREWFDRTDSQDFTILLGHTPNFILAVQDIPIDLCLAGHTHGGQIRIPCFGPLTVLSEIPLAWGRGYRPVGETHLNVSAGIGCEHYNEIPPIRLFCPPEMTLFRMEPMKP